jgi:hypothetical protein
MAPVALHGNPDAVARLQAVLKEAFLCCGKLHAPNRKSEQKEISNQGVGGCTFCDDTIWRHHQISLPNNAVGPTLGVV